MLNLQNVIRRIFFITYFFYYILHFKWLKTSKWLQDLFNIIVDVYLRHLIQVQFFIYSIFLVKNKLLQIYKLYDIIKVVGSKFQVYFVRSTGPIIGCWQSLQSNWLSIMGWVMWIIFLLILAIKYYIKLVSQYSNRHNSRYGEPALQNNSTNLKTIRITVQST